MRKCSDCQVEKPESDFHKQSARPDGLRAHCKACATARKKRWYEANKEKQAVKFKQWYEANRQTVALRMKLWYEHNGGTRAACCIARKDRQALRTPKWADIGAINRVYKAARRQGLTVDHYYPLFGKTVSGLHVVENLRIIPQPENDSKGNKHPDEFYSCPV